MNSLNLIVATIWRSATLGEEDNSSDFDILWRDASVRQVQMSEIKVTDVWIILNFEKIKGKQKQLI